MVDNNDYLKMALASVYTASWFGTGSSWHWHRCYSLRVKLTNSTIHSFFLQCIKTTTTEETFNGLLQLSSCFNAKHYSLLLPRLYKLKDYVV